MRLHRRGLTCAALAACLLASGCDRPPSADGLAEWTAADHDHAEENQRVQAGAQASATPKGAGDDKKALVDLTWRQQCASCHGPMGHGDGPTGPMVQASDLTNERWQATVTDEQIADVIRRGKGKMPKFSLPDRVVVGLVERIRSIRGR